MKQFCFGFLLITLPILSWAQGRTQVSANLSYMIGGVKDQAYSPLQYDLSGPKFELDYRRYSRSGNAHWEFGLGLGFPSLETDASAEFQSDLYSGGLHLGYWRKIPSRKERINFSLGAQAQVQANFVDYLGLESFSYVFAYSLDIGAQLELELNKDLHFQTRLVLPTLAYVVRPHYSGFDKEIADNSDNTLLLISYNGELSFWQNYFSVQWSNQLSLSLSEKLDASMHYGFSLQSGSVPFDYTFYAHQIGLGLNLKF